MTAEPLGRDLRSVESKLAALPPEEREAILDGVNLEELLYSWDYHARVDQMEATDSEEPVTLISTGRGTGKTRTGGEWIRRRIDTKPPNLKLRFALTARTSADVRDVMINGESGLMNIFPPSQTPVFVANNRLVKFYDGSEALCFSSIEPSQLRGPQFHYGWADELAAWSAVPDDSGLTAWQNMQIAVRLGENPQILATTTPKRVAPIRTLYDRAKNNLGVKLITGASTQDNPHLAEVYRDMIYGLFAGTRLGDQELLGLLMDDVEGALWQLEAIADQRVESPGRLPNIVVGVDPSVADQPKDECGIVVACSTADPKRFKRHAYVLEDASVWGPPSVWAKRVVQTAKKYNAPVIAEVNNGGALIREVIHGIDPTIRVVNVSAKVGKKLRADPVTLAYDQGRVHHVDSFFELEDQMTTWIPGETKDSPDRVDALVYALSALILPSSTKVGAGPTRVKAQRGHLDLGVRVRR